MNVMYISSNFLEQSIFLCFTAENLFLDFIFILCEAGVIFSTMIYLNVTIIFLCTHGTCHGRMLVTIQSTTFLGIFLYLCKIL